MANSIEPGSRVGRLRQRQTLKDIREEGLSLEMQLYVADQEDYKFTRAVLAALQVNIEDARAGREAALREAHQSNLDCTAAQEASKSAEQRAAQLQKQIEAQDNTLQSGAVAAAHGNDGTRDFQTLQRQLEEKISECESLEGSLEEALEQAVCATNDAEMWHGAYQQTVNADLERQNGELLCEIRQLKEEVERAMAAAERADRRLTADAHTRRIAERVQAQQLKQKKQKYEEREKEAKKAQLEAERRSETAETRACDSSVECARLKQELLTLQAQLNDRQQAEPVHAVAPPAGQQIVYTTSTEAVALEPLPAEAVPSCGDAATPFEVSAPPAASGHMTGATALVAGEPTAPPMMVDGQAGFGSPIVTAAPTTVAAATEDKAAPRRPALRPIAIRLGSGGSLQPGEGFVTPGHPGALAQGSYKTSPSGEWAVFSSAASSDCAYQAQAHRRALQEAAADAARASGGPSGSVLGVVSPRAGHPPEGTPEVLADRQVLEEGYVSSSGQEQGKLAAKSLDGAQQQPSPAGTPRGLPAQHKAAGRQPIIINLGSWSLPQPGDELVTPGLPGALAQRKYNTPPSGEWAVFDTAASSDRAYQAQAARRVLQAADADAASVPGGANGSVFGAVSPRGGGHTPQNTPDFLAMLWDNELFEPEAGTQALEEPHVSRSGLDLGRSIVMSLDGVLQQPSPAGTPIDGARFSTPVANSGLGVHGGTTQSHGEAHMPTGISPEAQDGIYAGMTPEFWLPAMTPPSTAHSQGNQDMAPAQQEQAARAAEQGRCLSDAALRPSPASTPMDDSAFRTPATGVMPGHGLMISTHGGGHMPTGLSPGYVMTTPDFYLPVLTPVSCTPLVPASAAADRTVGREPFTDLPLFCGAQKRAASALATQATEDPLSPSQLHCLKKQRQIPEQDAAASQQAAAMQATLQLGKLTGPNPSPWGLISPTRGLPIRQARRASLLGRQKRAASAADQQATEDPLSPHCLKKQRQMPEEDAAAPQQAAALQPTLQLGKLTGPNPFAMGVDQPNKRAAAQAGRKGKPARKAAASIKSTARSSKPAQAMAPSSSSSSSLPLQGGGQSDGAPARPSLLGPTGATQQAVPDAAWKHTVGMDTSQQQQAGRSLPRPGWGKPPLHPGTVKQKRSRSGTTCQGPAPSQAAQQGQHHAALSQPAQASNSAVVANSGQELAPPVAPDSAPPVSAEAPGLVIAGTPSSRATDLAPAATAESGSVVTGGGTAEEAKEGTGCTPTVDSLSDSTLAEDSVDGQAGHVQDGPASVMDDAAKKEVQGVVAQLQQAAVVGMVMARHPLAVPYPFLKQGSNGHGNMMASHVERA
ncbi:hypothetical protein WJX79_009296 [Trebouxia sp. C0005]